MPFRVLLVACALLCLGATLMAQNTAPLPSTAEREIAEFAEAIDRAQRDKDANALERLIGDGFEFVHSTGRLEERASFIQRAAAGHLAVQRNPGKMLSSHVRIFGTMAIRTTRTAVQMDGPDAAPTQVYTRYVYVKSGESWRWISAQSTTVSPAVAATIK